MSLVVREFRAYGFRSLKAVAFPMSDLDVFVGANGAGKTNLYRGLELLRSAAANTLARDLAAEGGLRSASPTRPAAALGPASATRSRSATRRRSPPPSRPSPTSRPRP